MAIEYASGKKVETPKPKERKETPREPKTKANRVPKKMMSIRLDQDVLDALRATGRDYQGRINDLLRKHVGL